MGYRFIVPLFLISLLSVGAVSAQGIRDIKPPIDFPFNFLPLVVFLIILVVLIIAFLIVKIHKRKKQAKETPVAMPSAHDIAYEALRALSAKNLPQEGKIKEYYFQLSMIVRSYIENRFAIKAPDMTTEEFLTSLKEAPQLSGEHKHLLENFLKLSDIVKFAKYGPTPGEISESFEAAKKFVDETKVEENNSQTVVKR